MTADRLNMKRRATCNDDNESIFYYLAWLAVVVQQWEGFCALTSQMLLRWTPPESQECEEMTILFRSLARHSFPLLTLGRTNPLSKPDQAGVIDLMIALVEFDQWR
ncbi:hypothetical protein BDP55DRAFT_637022 [Colletotrichum godetiae]|uniref:Uncharacterized protein n=1 Tax=Colletotrichum godetiae TaxID=1209918 RepID=A0AAJ0ESC4_9PEZI|nr:uncharacterized protein BDP55DRAFT_637022 [Colletotrichum godetiae]KAK1659404.1 hypothetical protein BDP55DRAFT_637022 [Colletotrichum godetiae]